MTGVNDTKVKSTDSIETKNNDSNVDKVKKKRRLKVPSALSILIGVAFFSIIITWVIHMITVGDYGEGTAQAVAIYHLDAATNTLIFDGWWEGGNTWYITEGANAIVDGQWGVITNGSALGSDITNDFGLFSPITDTDWFNFSGSDWYVSDDGMYGIGNFVLATIAGAFSAADLIFFIIGIAIIVEILMETNILKSLVNSMIIGMKDKKILLVPSLFILFSLWGTITGSQEATLALMPLVVTALIVAGFDAATGFMVILVGVTTGISASVLEPFALGTLAQEFDNVWQSAGYEGTIGIGTGIALRTLLFLAYTTIGCIFVTWYGNRVLKHKKSVETEEMQNANREWAEKAFNEEDHIPLNKKQKTALWVIGLTMLWMVIVLLPWLSWFPSLKEQAWWGTLSHIFFFQSFIGGWSFFELGLLFVLGWFICAKTFGYTGSQMWNNWKNAWNKFFVVALILTFSRATSIILTNSGVATFLATTIFASATEGLGPLGLSLIVFPIYIIMALFIPSMSGLAGISAPIIAPIVGGYGNPDDMKMAIVGIMALYPLAQGLVNMTSPTTGLVVAQAEASNTDYARTLPLLVGYAGVIAVVGVTIISLSFLI